MRNEGASDVSEASRADEELWQEVAQQPAVLAGLEARQEELETLGRSVFGGRPSLVVLVARGTSDNAAIYARYLLEVLCEIPVSLAAPSVYTLYGRTPRLDGAVVLACSQSGASPDLVEVVRRTRAAGARTLALVNRVDSPLAAAADHVVDIGAGEEKSVAATKSFTAQLMALAGLVLGAATGDEAEAVRTSFGRVAAAAAGALERRDEVEAWARGHAGWRTMYVVGRGLVFPVALEIALKMKEMAGVVAEGYSAADVRHGPIALSGPDLPFLVAGGSGPAARDLVELARAARAGGSPVTALTDSDGLARAADEALRFPALPEMLSAVPLAVLGQMAAYFLALGRGLHPGTPAAIRKVTRTL
jgi:glutamine---fructose-6-phosphate transaminase (isomerizing)